MARKIISLKPIRNQTVRCGWVWRAHVTVMNADNTEVAETYDYEIEKSYKDSIENVIHCSEEAGENDTLEFIYEPCYTYEAKIVEILSTNIDFEHKKISVKYVANIIMREGDNPFDEQPVFEAIERECEFSDDMLGWRVYSPPESDYRLGEILMGMLTESVEDSDNFKELNSYETLKSYGFVDDVII